MQQSPVFSRISISTAFSTYLFIILFTTNALAASLVRPTETRDLPAISIPRALLIPRAPIYNLTEFFVQACGESYVVCGETSCCSAGNECLIGSQSGGHFCRSLDGTTATPSATSTPSSSSKAPIGAIVGGVLGAVAAIAIACTLFLLHRRRRKPTTPAIPQAPIPNLPNVIEAKYPPPNETSYSGENWPPGSFLYHSRNRSVSTASQSCVSPDGHTAVCDANVKKYTDNTDQDEIMELPGTQPTIELQGDDGYFAAKPYIPPPPEDNIEQLSRSPTDAGVSPMSQTPRRLSVQYWKRGRSS
ncbi:hypothetical protein TWF481_009572 [Arthrobotrys musiformis]|uniref:Uncharacterized protein n=1 Tax=Arthrobotrys musiformis TaxID=47236 RepID=A0AAV9W653_9PEZI